MNFNIIIIFSEPFYNIESYNYQKKIKKIEYLLVRCMKIYCRPQYTYKCRLGYGELVIYFLVVLQYFHLSGYIY